MEFSVAFFLDINQSECGNECGYTLKKVMTAKLYCLLVWEPHILRFLRKKTQCIIWCAVSLGNL